MRTIELLLIVSLASAFSCSKASSSSSSDQNPTEESKKERDDEVAKIANELRDRASSLNRYLGEGGKCDGLKYPDETSPCYLEEISFKGAAPLQSSIGKRILILDDRMTYLGTTSFKDRVLATYQFQPGTNALQPFPYDFVEGKDKFKAPRFYLDIHSRLIGESKVKVPSKAFRSLWDDYNEKTLGRFENYFSIESLFTDHPSFGYMNLVFLYDHIPDAQFVLVNEEVLDRYHVQPEVFCDIANTPEADLNAMFAGKIQQVRQVVKQHDVNYIVVPENFRFDEMKEHFEDICTAEMDEEVEKSLFRLNKMAGEYRDSMTSIEGVTVFHAAPKIFTDTDHPLCQSFDNRVVTGSTKRNVVFTSIPPEGSRDIERYTENSSGNTCVDAFVHIARTRDGSDSVRQTASYSTLEFNDKVDNMIVYMSRSRISPSVALAYAIHKKQKGELQGKNIKALFTDKLVISPVQHRLTPMCQSDDSYCDYFYKYF